VVRRVMEVAGGIGTPVEALDDSGSRIVILLQRWRR
jgi:hypothetical protein